MADEPVEIRVARLEERTESLENSFEYWRDMLTKDIADTKALIAKVEQGINTKLDTLNNKLETAIQTAQRSLPTWVHYAIWILLTAVGFFAGLRLR